jgi:hypothetical protein
VAYKCCLNTRTPLEVWTGTRLHLLGVDEDDNGRVTAKVSYRRDGDEAASMLTLRRGERFELDGRTMLVASLTPRGLYPLELHEIR